MAETARQLPGSIVATPNVAHALRALLEADLAVQMRNIQALAISYALPVILLVATFSGKRGARLGDPLFRVATSLILGTAAIALIGYSLGIARDREGGVFQRLRVTPTPSWAILGSRLLIQAAAVLTMVLVVLIAASVFESVRLNPGAYVLTVVVMSLVAAEFLGIGQALVGLIKSSETIRAISPLVLAPLVAGGLLGHADVLGTTFETIALWSPGGAVGTILAGAMDPSSWGSDAWWSLLVTAAYSIVFIGIGLRWFQWSSR